MVTDAGASWGSRRSSRRTSSTARRCRAAGPALEELTSAFGRNEFEYPEGSSSWRSGERPHHPDLCALRLIGLGIGAGVRSHREEYGYLEGIAIVVVVCFVVFLQAGIDYGKEPSPAAQLDEG